MLFPLANSNIHGHIKMLFSLSGKYLFIETSDPVLEGDNAILQSELFDPESDMVCFHFFYNMFGVSIGTLRVWLLYYNTSLNKLPVISRQVVWELSGNQSQAWYEGIVPISSPQKSYKVGCIVTFSFISSACIIA